MKNYLYWAQQLLIVALHQNLPELGSNGFGHTRTGPPKWGDNWTFWLECGLDWIKKDQDHLGTLFQPRGP